MKYNQDGNYIFRVEGYYKDYSNLVLVNKRDFLIYRSQGKGYVKGVDAILKTKIKNKFTGWISYAFCDSKREQYESVL